MAFVAHKSFGFWLYASRPQSLGQSLSAYLVGAAVGLAAAATHGVADWRCWVLVILGFFGVAAAHSGLNLMDDYFDMRCGAVAARQQMNDGGMRQRMGKCEYLKAGVGIRDLFRAGTAFLVIAAGIGAVIVVGRGWPVLIFAALGLVLGLFYSGPPLRLSYHVFGEITVGMIFGPLEVLAVYYLATGRLDSIAAWVSVPAGLLTVNILHTHSIMDFESDRDFNRVTLAVALGSQRRALVAGAVILGACYLSVAGGIAAGALSPWSWLVFGTLPMALGYLRLMWLYVYHPDRKIKYQGWMGPMEPIARRDDTGIQWFLLRWMCARNLMMAFMLVLAATTIIPEVLA